MKKTKRQIRRLSRHATDEEIVRWTKRHDVFHRLDAGVSEVVEDHSDLDAMTLARIWLAERLERELKTG